MAKELLDLVPVDKYDTERVAGLIALGYPAVEPILPQILVWMQDANWPVAQALQPFLEEIGAPLAPHLRSILATDDEIWKYWILGGIVRHSSDLARILRPELERIATSNSSEPDLPELASEILADEQAGRLP